MEKSSREERKLFILSKKKKQLYLSREMMGKTRRALLNSDIDFKIRCINQRSNALNTKHPDLDPVYKKLYSIITSDYEVGDVDYNKFVFCSNHLRGRMANRTMTGDDYDYLLKTPLSELRENCRKISRDDHLDIHDGKISLIDKLKN